MPLTDDAFEALVQQLQQQSFTDAFNAYGEKGFERWRNPRFNKPIDGADCSSMVSGSCGDSIGLSLKFRDNRVEQASYRTDGCASSQLCGSFTAELAIGRTPKELLALEANDVLAAIGCFPREDRHCASLAIQALHQALKEYQNRNDH
jgi:nitrogen fixation NifU-like protein